MAPTRSRISPGVRWLLLMSGIVFVVQHLVDFRAGGAFTVALGLSRHGFLGEAHLWQVITYIFLHGGFFHILMNMLVLFVFGRELEDYLGTDRFLYLYMACGIVAGLGWLMISGAGPAVCIGASGAVFGIAAAYAALNPNRVLTLLIFPLPIPVKMKARTMIIVFGAATMVFLFFDQGNIAHAAHLAGGLVGYFYGRRAKPKMRVMASPEATPWQSARWPQDAEEDGMLRTEEAPEPPEAHEINTILEKIKSEGIGSLSRRERATLEAASRKGR